MEKMVMEWLTVNQPLLELGRSRNKRLERSW